MTVEDARYSHTSRDHNRLLLFALVQAWGDRCYWCKTPKTFRDLQIDHMIPRNPRDGGDDPEFDVDAATNLAPICGPCNQEKGNGAFEDAPRSDAACKAAAELDGGIVAFQDGSSWRWRCTDREHISTAAYARKAKAILAGDH